MAEISAGQRWWCITDHYRCSKGSGPRRRKRCEFCGSQRFVAQRGFWCVFAWRGDGLYRLDDALKRYSRVGFASTACRKLNEDPDDDYPEGGYVVQFISIRDDEA